MSERGASHQYVLTDDQVRAFLLSLVALDDQVLAGLQLFCALRIGEVAHLRAPWVRHGGIHIPSQQECGCTECMQRRSGLWKPKTTAGARVLPIVPELATNLEHWLPAHAEGFGVSRVRLYQRTKLLLKRAKVRISGPAGDTAFPHALRATCLTRLATGGMDAAAFAYFAGWGDIAVASHYINLARARAKAQEQALEILS